MRPPDRTRVNWPVDASASGSAQVGPGGRHRWAARVQVGQEPARQKAREGYPSHYTSLVRHAVAFWTLSGKGKDAVRRMGGRPVCVASSTSRHVVRGPRQVINPCGAEYTFGNRKIAGATRTRGWIQDVDPLATQGACTEPRSIRSSDPAQNPRYSFSTGRINSFKPSRDDCPFVTLRSTDMTVEHSVTKGH